MRQEIVLGNSIAIRPAGPADASKLAALGAATFVETFGHLYKDEDLAAFLKESHSAEAYEELLADDAWRIWIAETAEGQAVGFAVAGPCSLPVPDRPENSGELSRLYILKSHQGGGLGTRMIEPILKYLRARFENIYLSVYSENYGAQKLYQRYGFEKIADYFFMVGDHADPEWIMQLKR
jgi:ribosomal protein S18 acetylase RimI-like enzyme